MNRPFWLDTLRVGAFLAVPLVLATVVASVVSDHFGWPGWAWALSCLVAAVLLVAAWLAVFVALSRLTATDRDAP